MFAVLLQASALYPTANTYRNIDLNRNVSFFPNRAAPFSYTVHNIAYGVICEPNDSHVSKFYSLKR